MMTSQEHELVEYLKHHPVVMNSTVLVDRDIIEKSLSYLLENEITILSLSFVTLSENGIEKIENANISYLDDVASMDKMIADIGATSVEYSHVEISIRLKKQP